MDTQANVSTEALGVFGWGGVEINLDDIPRETFVALAKQGIRHKLANEVAAGLIKVKEKAEKDGSPLDEDGTEAATIELRQAMIQKILDGTVGLRIGGPRGTTIENIAFELAMKQAEDTLAPKGYWPKLSKEDRKLGKKVEDVTIDFAGRPMTREELGEMVLEKYKAKFLEDAKGVHAARLEKAKLAKANAVPVVATVDEDVESLI